MRFMVQPMISDNELQAPADAAERDIVLILKDWNRASGREAGGGRLLHFASQSTGRL